MLEAVFLIVMLFQTTIIVGVGIKAIDDKAFTTEANSTELINFEDN